MSHLLAHALKAKQLEIVNLDYYHTFAPDILKLSRFELFIQVHQWLRHTSIEAMDRIGYTGLYGRSFRRSYAKLLMQIFVLIIGPIRAYGFYHYDVMTDYLQTYNYFANCHYKYGFTSLAVMLSSYIATVLHLKFFLKNDLLNAMKYPFILG